MKNIIIKLKDKGNGKLCKSVYEEVGQQVEISMHIG